MYKEMPSIGIISPCKRQVNSIKKQLTQKLSVDWTKYIQVNTVDSFQGQEKDIIIFSTVRANSGMS